MHKISHLMLNNVPISEDKEDVSYDVAICKYPYQKHHRFFFQWNICTKETRINWQKIYIQETTVPIHKRMSIYCYRKDLEASRWHIYRRHSVSNTSTLFHVKNWKRYCIAN